MKKTINPVAGAMLHDPKRVGGWHHAAIRAGEGEAGHGPGGVGADTRQGRQLLGSLRPGTAALLERAAFGVARAGLGRAGAGAAGYRACPVGPQQVASLGVVKPPEAPRSSISTGVRLSTWALCFAELRRGDTGVE